MTTRKKRIGFSTLLTILLLGAAFVATACGVKGPPLPPLGKPDSSPRPSSTPKVISQ